MECVKLGSSKAKRGVAENKYKQNGFSGTGYWKHVARKEYCKEWLRSTSPRNEGTHVSESLETEVKHRMEFGM